MLPTHWDPFAEMEKMMGRFPSLLQQHGIPKGFVPAVDMYETKDAVMVELPLAGIDAKDVEISIENGILTIKGKSTKEHEMDEKNYYRKEVRSGSFFRQVSFPVSVKEDEVVAESEDGMLKITCPKAEPTKAKKMSVEIKKKVRNN